MKDKLVFTVWISAAPLHNNHIINTLWPMYKCSAASSCHTGGHLVYSVKTASLPSLLSQHIFIVLEHSTSLFNLEGHL